EQEEGAQQRGRRERGEDELDELVGQPVVPCVTRPPADDLDDHGEDRDAENEGREVQVELGDRPYCEPRPDEGKGAIRGLAGSLLRQRRKSGEQHGGGSHGQSRPCSPANRTVLPHLDPRTRNSQRRWPALARDELVLSFTGA